MGVFLCWTCKHFTDCERRRYAFRVHCKDYKVKNELLEEWEVKHDG